MKDAAALVSATSAWRSVPAQRCPFQAGGIVLVRSDRRDVPRIGWDVIVPQLD